MPSKKLTDAFIRSLTTETRKDFWDTQFIGGSFGIRVTPLGRKTFMLRYKGIGGRKRYTLGQYPALSLSEARKSALKLMGNITCGEDPQLDKQSARLAETVNELFEDYFSHRELSEKTRKLYTYLFDTHIKEPLGSVKLKELKKAHVIPVLKKVASHAPTSSDQTRRLLISAMNFALSLDLIEYNPLLRIPKYGHTRIGERYLSKDEIEAYLKKVSSFDVPEKVYFRLLLKLGMRPGELAAIRWEFVVGDVLQIPATFQKNGKALHTPLVSSIRRDIMQLRSVTGNTEFLFPGPDPSKSRKAFRKYKHRIDKVVSGERWTLRDIRRTTETHMNDLGIEDSIIAALLNHNTSRLKRIYDKSQRIKDKAQALERWCAWLAKLEQGDENGKVLRL